MHKAVFFVGNAYFNMGNKEEEETAAYAEADALRKQVSVALSVTNGANLTTIFLAAFTC